ncbi:hypothetical protein GCM10010390_48670 [Streptomyces mordarskii]|uniref:Uncharacterized protein n=1 Tax=Streptomyces mordarskii TaxID=1226758 RepID=A0ABN1DDU0_9ACTN
MPRPREDQTSHDALTELVQAQADNPTGFVPPHRWAQILERHFRPDLPDPGHTAEQPHHGAHSTGSGAPSEARTGVSLGAGPGLGCPGPARVAGGGWKAGGMNGDEHLLRGRVYGCDHDDPDPGPLPHQT